MEGLVDEYKFRTGAPWIQSLGRDPLEFSGQGNQKVVYNRK